MALGMLAATFMDIQNSVAYRPRGDFVLCKCEERERRCCASIIVTDVSNRSKLQFTTTLEVFKEMFTQKFK